MEQLYVFGTGNAQATRCYNTCFAIRDPGGEFFMVDAGGGNGILRILDEMGVGFGHIHHMFVTHEHTDHVLGVVWIVRMIATAMRQGKYDGDMYIYCHEGLVSTIDTLCKLTLQDKFYILLGERIHLTPVQDGETRRILGYDVTFFDILSTKAKQYGFTTTLESGRTLTCAGDEPYNPACEKYVRGRDWLLHEAFCLYGQRDRWKPYEKNHSTVKDASVLAQDLDVKRLVLWHTEDSDLEHRKETYCEEGRPHFSGILMVPDDREVIEL
jgi:ribonuclease Z